VTHGRQIDDDEPVTQHGSKRADGTFKYRTSPRNFRDPPERSLSLLDGQFDGDAEGLDLTGEGGLLTDLVRQVLQTGLEVELADHLGYEPYDPVGRGSGNSRNGSYPKTVATEIGDVELQMPRDRNGTFSPVTVPKHQRRLDGLAGNVISLYAKGLTTGDIQSHLLEIYGQEISRETISKITDAIVEDMIAWQNRPLDALYPVLLIDAIMIKVRDAQVANRPVYVAIGVNLDGERDVLGLWLGPTGGEGAKQWMTMLTELRNRGIADALIVCCDGVEGPARRGAGDLARRHRADLCRAHGAQLVALRVEEALAGDHQTDASDLHRTDRRGRRSAVRQLRGQLAGPLPGDDLELGVGLERVRAVPRLPGRAAQGRLHDADGFKNAFRLADDASAVLALVAEGRGIVAGATIAHLTSETLKEAHDALIAELDGLVAAARSVPVSL